LVIETFSFLSKHLGLESTKRILKRLDEMEMTWSAQQRERSGGPELLSKCKEHQGPFVKLSSQGDNPVCFTSEEIMDVIQSSEKTISGEYGCCDLG